MVVALMAGEQAVGMRRLLAVYRHLQVVLAKQFRIGLAAAKFPGIGRLHTKANVAMTRRSM